MSEEALRPAQIFVRLLGGAVAPALKSRGWVRKEQTFFLNEGENWGIINFQKSRKSNKDNIIFTINLGVVSGLLLRFLSGRTNSERPDLGDCHWKCRIGILLPENDDKWWVIDTNTSSERLGQEILDCLMGLAVPEIQKYLSNTALEELWLSGHSPGLTKFQRLVYLSVLLKASGPHEALQNAIQELRCMAESDPEDSAATYYLNKLEQMNQ